MKPLVFLYAGDSSSLGFNKIFSSQSAFDRALVWAKEVENAPLCVACNPQTQESVRSAVNAAGITGVKLVCRDSWNTSDLLETLAKECASFGTGFAVYACADNPFLDAELTKKVIEYHKKYLAEYTFADGWPLGFAPEVIDSGTLSLLHSLSLDRQKREGEAPVTASSIFNVMKGDLNSFEIESVVSPKDYRMLRFDFSCKDKARTLSCEKLYNLALDTRTPFTADSLSELAEKSAGVQHTVPAFYAIQITGKYAQKSVYLPEGCASEKQMSLEQFNALVSQIAELSDNAVVSLSAWGEPLLHPQLASFVSSVLSYPKLSVLIETDGTALSEELASKIASSADCSRITWIVSVDAVTDETYKKMHGPESLLERSVNAVKILEKHFPGSVYPQFMRMNVNENELEKFYRFWHDEKSPSNGKVIIQKYDWFCSLMSQEKPADLSPLERNPCWHLKRDITILADGSVPLCREYILDGSMGNVFTEGLEAVWQKFLPFVEEHICGKYSEKCGKCDEYYTFNF